MDKISIQLCLEIFKSLNFLLNNIVGKKEKVELGSVRIRNFCWEHGSKEMRP